MKWLQATSFQVFENIQFEQSIRRFSQGIVLTPEQDSIMKKVIQAIYLWIEFTTSEEALGISKYLNDVD